LSDLLLSIILNHPTTCGCVYNNYSHDIRLLNKLNKRRSINFYGNETFRNALCKRFYICLSNFVSIFIPYCSLFLLTYCMLKPIGLLPAFYKFCPRNGYLTTTSRLNMFKWDDYLVDNFVRMERKRIFSLIKNSISVCLIGIKSHKILQSILRGLHINVNCKRTISILVIKPTRCTKFSNLFLE